MGTSEKLISSPLSPSVEEMILSINHNSEQLTLLMNKLFKVLGIMGRQNQLQTLITEQEIEEWVAILNTVLQEHQSMKQKLKQDRDENP